MAMESLWSFQMLIGAPTARLAHVSTIGMRMPEMLNSTSAISMIPCEELAV